MIPRLLTPVILIACVVPAPARVVHNDLQDKPQEKAAAKPAAQLPSLDKVLDDYVKAMGGKAAIQKITSRSSKGTLEAPAAGLTGKFEQYTKLPNKMSLTVDLSVAVYKAGFLGTTGWILDPGSGLRDMTANEVAEGAVDNDFYRSIRLKELYSKLEVKDKVKVGDRDAYLVEATFAGREPDKLYFDAATGLLIRAVAKRETGQGAEEVETSIEDYRDVDGIKVPFTIRRTTPNFSFTVKLTEITQNAPIDDAKFAKPQAQ
ncbi:MAG TPA: hypothetical protein VFV34_21980 [Blastocatellia bacterium]|nr:hypothetical protein [Blastocatellia bacterium]